MPYRPKFPHPPARTFGYELPADVAKQQQVDRDRTGIESQSVVFRLLNFLAPYSSQRIVGTNGTFNVLGIPAGSGEASASITPWKIEVRQKEGGGFEARVNSVGSFLLENWIPSSVMAVSGLGDFMDVSLPCNVYIQCDVSSFYVPSNATLRFDLDWILSTQPTPAGNESIVTFDDGTDEILQTKARLLLGRIDASGVITQLAFTPFAFANVAVDGIAAVYPLPHTGGVA